MNQRFTLTLLAFGLATAFVACAEGDGGGPAPVGPQTEEPTPEPEGPAPGTPVRTVSRRNPFGNVAAVDNLLWDGDFEWRPAFEDQYGWLTSGPFGLSFALPKLATGSACRSGIKCAYLAPGDGILGIAVGSEGNELMVSFWMRPESGECGGLRAVYIPVEAGSGASAAIEPMEDTPDAEGWCRYEQVVPERNESAYLSIDNLQGAPVVIDDAVVRPADPEAMQARSRTRTRKLSSAEVTELDRRIEEARLLRQPRRAPTPRGQEKLSAHLKKLARGKR